MSEQNVAGGPVASPFRGRAGARTVDLIITLAGVLALVVAVPGVRDLSGRFFSDTARVLDALLPSEGSWEFNPALWAQNVLSVTPVFLLGAAIGAAIVTLSAGRRAWWIPPAGLALALAVVFFVPELLTLILLSVATGPD